MKKQEQYTQKGELPIHKFRQKIVQTINKNKAIIISGLTGCGKSTQVPQFILDSDPSAYIAVCEPRRLAATSLAIRVSEQRKANVGFEVGYQIGMQTKRSQKTKIVYMTYGILIQQLLFSQSLSYTHIILDEVHQRSLEMDFAFIALKKLINQKQINMQQLSQSNNAKNQKLKLIIMSATLNSIQFQKFFSCHKTKRLFIQPDIIIQVIQHNSRRRGRDGNRHKRGNYQDENQNNQSNKQFQKIVKISYKNQGEYQQAPCIELKQKMKHKVEEFFIQDIDIQFSSETEIRNQSYKNRQDARIEDRLYNLAKTIILKNHPLQSSAIMGLSKKQQDSKFQQQLLKKVQICGDILVFLPGMVQIKKMKQILINQNETLAQKIIQVHSAFSEDLYKKLFSQKVKNKIILATNIGQSSITLPNCKTVVDFCLNRKAYSNVSQGISRFQTVIASKSNLIQRKGRVGRVSDGSVYRLITKKQYNQLPQFDKPQIKCVSLEMAILKAKQLDINCKNQLFQDIYDIFLNVLQPPDIEDIQKAIEVLIHEEALVYNSSQKKQKQKQKKYQGENLKITKVGQFMVSMPCDLSISKLILMGIKLGITSVIVDIAAIIINTKGFFAHQQRRHNIEEFMHSLIGYDRGYSNDYLLRQRLFSHWRDKFFIPFRQIQKMKKCVNFNQQNHFLSKNQITEVNKNKYIQKTKQSPMNFVQKHSNQNQKKRNYQYVEESQFDQNYKIVQKFSKQKWSPQQNQFCKLRGVYANVLRQILKVSENLKLKIDQLGIDKEKLGSIQVSNQFIILCLMYAFPDIICSISHEQDSKSQKNWEKIIFENHSDMNKNSQISNFVCLEFSKKLTPKGLQLFMDPQVDYQIFQKLKWLQIHSNSSKVLRKLLLPRFYTKAQITNCSQIYSHLIQKKPYYKFQSVVRHKFQTILILNQSINKVIIQEQDQKSSQKKNKFLITHNLIQSKGRSMIGMCALVPDQLLVMIQMIIKKDIIIKMHVSKQFYSHIKFQGTIYQIPMTIVGQHLKLIKQLRKLSQRQKQNLIISQSQQLPAQKLKLLEKMLQPTAKKREIQIWQQLFLQEEKINKTKNQQSKQEQESWFKIDEAPMKIQHKKQSFYQRYYLWKLNKYNSINFDFKLFNNDECSFLCRKCFQNREFVEIQLAKSYNYQDNTIKINKYSGGWKCKEAKDDQIQGPGFILTCKNLHSIGISLDQDIAQVYANQIMLYIPFNETYLLSTLQTEEIYQQKIKKGQNSGKEQLQKRRLQWKEFQCPICYKGQYERIIIKRNDVNQKSRNSKSKYNKDQFWKKVACHMYDQKHIKNSQKFKQFIKYN